MQNKDALIEKQAEEIKTLKDDIEALEVSVHTKKPYFQRKNKGFKVKIQQF
jgi:hypothetical protein